MIGCAEKLFIFIFYFYSVGKLKTTIFVVGEIGGNEIDAITESIISTKTKKKIPFYFPFKINCYDYWFLILYYNSIGSLVMVIPQ